LEREMTVSRTVRNLLPARSAVWLAIGLLAGFSSGAYVALKWIAPAQSWLAYVGQGFLLTQIASGQYVEAEYPAAKAALEDYLSYLEASEPRQDSWAPGQEPWLDEHGLAFDKALTAGRLALLEERKNHGIAAAEYWARAEVYARAAAWRDPSRENIRKFLARVDELGDPQERPDAEGDAEKGDT
jgi:hypothetical protein